MTSNKFNAGFHDHLSYYIANQISPVHQNLKNLQNHLDRRSFLYDSLGITKLLIKNSRIFEFGPGSGHNSLYVSKLNSKNYFLFEPNPTGYKEIKNLYKKYKNIKSPKVFNNTLQDYSKKIHGCADIVICESWIGSLDSELKLINKFINMLNSNGILVLTFQPAIGMLPNMLRRIIGYSITEGSDNFSIKTLKLTNFFKKELKSISRMTRPYEDWVQDTLLSPSALTSVISLDSILKSLNNKFNILNTYPKYFKIYDWYKNFIGKKRNIDPIYLNELFKNYYNFLDMNHTYQADENILKSKKVDKLIYNLFYLMFNLEKKNTHLKEINRIKNILTKISYETKNLKTKKIIKDCLVILNSDNKYKKYYSENNSLLGLFGRELCYVSLQKKR